MDPATGEIIWTQEADAYTLNTPVTDGGTVYVGGSCL